MRYNNPLRYPGSKQRFSAYVAKFLEANFLVGSTICEPFAGGASVSLHLLSRKLVGRAVWVERDPLVYAFWKSVFEHTDELCDLIRESEVSIRTWRRLEDYRGTASPDCGDLVEMGFAGLFFNRANYSGIIAAGPIGGGIRLRSMTLVADFLRWSWSGGSGTWRRMDAMWKSPSVTVRKSSRIVRLPLGTMDFFT